jgi:hypothetical protein
MGVRIATTKFKQFLRIFRAKPRKGWSGSRAGIGRPQRPAIHRMEEEIQEKQEKAWNGQRIQLINEHCRML